MTGNTRADLESELPVVEEALAALERMDSEQLTSIQEREYTRVEMRLKSLRRSLEAHHE